MELKNDISDYYYNAPCGYFSLADDLTILEVNPTLENWIGTKQEKLHGDAIMSILTVGTAIYFHTHILPSMQAEGFINEIHTEIKDSDNHTFAVLMNGKYLAEKEKYLFSVMKIHQRKSYEEELLKATKKAESDAIELSKLNEDLKNFAFVLSHDLKSPLHNVTGLINIMQEDMYNNSKEENEEIMSLISESAKNMEDLIAGILSQYEKKKRNAPEKLVVDLNLFFTELNTLIDSKKQFNISYPKTEAVSIAINFSHLQQIFINLVSNAIKYTLDKETKIEIDYWADNNFHYFSVQDNGIGIKKEDQKRIFNLFQVLGKKDRFGETGTGIGLATVKKIVAKNGGEIEIESEENMGTKVSFTIQKK